MVVIPITANLFSVVTTLLSTLSELAMYRTLRRLLAIWQCRVMSQNRALSIRSQKKRLTAIAWGSLAIFVMLETVLSAFSDPVTIAQDTVEDCARLVATPHATQTLTAGELGDEARILCKKIDLERGFLVKEHGANISTTIRNIQNTERAVRCEEQELYGYFRGQQVNRDVRNHTAACVGGTCVYVIVDGEDVYLSARPTHEERSLEADKTWFAFLKTRVRFKIPNEYKRQMTMRLARAMERGERDEERLRALTLLGVRTDRCVRPDDEIGGRDGTEVAAWLLAGAGVIWMVTLGAGLAAESRWARKMGFFDMGCEVQWARKSFLENFREHHAGDGEVLIRGVMVDGERCVMVVHANNGEESFISSPSTTP